MNAPEQVCFDKSPKTFKEQVQILQARGLDVPDPQKATFYLSQLGYYRFASYCLPFESGHAEHKFREGTRFDEVLNLYTFDHELRLLALDAIERIEVSLRTQWAYHLSHNHHTAHPHLLSEIFTDTKLHDRLIKTLERDVARSKEKFIKDLIKKYREQLPPVWAVVELMTIGQLSKWFSNISAHRDRQDISRIYKVDEKIMTSFCRHLSLVRNHAAHHERLWNRNFTKTMMLPKKGHQILINSLLHLDQSDRRLRKLYNTLVMIGYLMDIVCPHHSWKQRLMQLIKDHHIDTHKMGFPDNWQDKPIWLVD